MTMNPGANATLWAYWEGPLSPYVSLCLEILRRFNPPRELRLIGPEEVRGLLGELPEEVRSQYVAHRADWLRFELLHRYGGM